MKCASCPASRSVSKACKSLKRQLEGFGKISSIIVNNSAEGLKTYRMTNAHEVLELEGRRKSVFDGGAMFRPRLLSNSICAGVEEMPIREDAVVMEVVRLML